MRGTIRDIRPKEPIDLRIYTPVEVLALAVRPLVIVVMAVLFAALPEVLGRRRGYLASFVFYWAAFGFALPVAMLGPARLLAMLGPGSWPGGLGSAALAVLVVGPPVGAALVYFRPRVAELTGPIVAASLAIALVNGVAEELLWRAIPVALFPREPVLAVAFPALGFAVWHLAPQIVLPARGRGGVVAFVLAAAVLGVCYGIVTYVTGSILAATVSHVLTDFLGLGGMLYLRSRSGAEPPLT